MKTCKFLLVLLAGMSLALASCSDGNGGGPSYGKISYDGMSVELNMASYLDIALPSGGSYKFFHIGRMETGKTVCGFNLPIHDPRLNYELKPDDISFIYGEKQYISSDKRKLYERWGDNNGSSSGSGSMFSVKSLGIDPATGKEIYLTRDERVEEFLSIESGYARWTAGASSGTLEFNLTFEDGKSAKGQATIPFSVFDK